MMSNLPNVDAGNFAELQSRTTPGIWIVGHKAHNTKSPLLISGKFVITEEEFERRGRVPHRDLVLSVLLDPIYGTFHPFKESIIFKDDVHPLSGFVGGWFNLDVFAYMGPPRNGDHYIRVSLGEALSNVIETRVALTDPGIA